MNRKSKIFLLCILFSAAMFAQEADTSKQMDPEAAKYYNKGIESLKAMNYSEAVAYFDSCLQKYPDEKVYQQKGFALFKNQSYDAALKEFDGLLARNAKNEFALDMKARTFYVTGKLEEAIAAYKNIAATTTNEKKKGDAEMQIAVIENEMALTAYNKGIELFKAGKNDEAIASYKRSLEIKKDFKPYYQMGVVYQKMQNNAEAIKMFEQTVALNDSFATAYSAMANVHFMDKDYLNAIPDYQKALSLAKNEQAQTQLKESIGRCYFQMGMASFGEKKYDKAIENFTKANEVIETDLNHLFLARAQGEKKQYDAALASFDKSLSIKKVVTETQVAYYKGSMFKTKGDVAKAIEQFKIASADEKYKKACESEIKYFEAKAKQDKEKKK